MNRIKLYRMFVFLIILLLILAMGIMAKSSHTVPRSTAGKTLISRWCRY